jgi:hypothetical protein
MLLLSGMPRPFRSRITGFCCPSPCSLNLLLDRHEHAKSRMAGPSIVEDLEVLEDCIRKFDTRFSTQPIEQFILQAAPEGLGHCVVVAASDGSFRQQPSAFAHNRPDGIDQKQTAIRARFKRDSFRDAVHKYVPYSAIWLSGNCGLTGPAESDPQVAPTCVTSEMNPGPAHAIERRPRRCWIQPRNRASVPIKIAAATAPPTNPSHTSRTKGGRLSA